MYYNLDGIEIPYRKKVYTFPVRETPDSRRSFTADFTTVAVAKWKVSALTSNAETSIDLYEYLATTGIRNAVEVVLSDNEGEILEFEIPYEVKSDSLSLSTSRNLPAGYKSLLEFTVEMRFPMLWIPLNKEGQISYDESKPYILDITASFYDKSTGKLLSQVQIT
jgi:hypothetical protein